MCQDYIDLMAPGKAKQCQEVTHIDRALRWYDMGLDGGCAQMRSQPPRAPDNCDGAKPCGIEARGGVQKNRLGPSGPAGVYDMQDADHVLGHRCEAAKWSILAPSQLEQKCSIRLSFSA